MLATEMAADQHGQPGARAAARLFGELQREPLGRHDVVAPDGAFFFDAEDLLETSGRAVTLRASRSLAFQLIAPATGSDRRRS